MSLSNKQIIALLNRYFVPVVTSNADYEEKGAAPRDEKAELARIHQEGYAAKLSVGSVHVYILKPDGHLLDSMHTAQAADPKRLIPMLEKAVQKLKPTGGSPLVTPAPPPPPRAEPGDLRLNLVARYLEKQGDEYRLTSLGESRGNWGDLPSIEWITLRPAEWKKLLPSGKARLGTQWTIDREVASALLIHFYPPVENWEVKSGLTDQISLQAVVVSIQNGVARARIEGAVRRKQAFYHTKEDDRYVKASVVGFLEFAPDGSRIHALRLVTNEAVYAGDGSSLPFGVTLRSVAIGE